MAHTVSEGKAMTCPKCKGQMIVWEKIDSAIQKQLLVRYATKVGKVLRKS